MKKFEMTYCSKDEWMATKIIEAKDWIEARRKLRDELGIKTVNELDYLYEKEIERR